MADLDTKIRQIGKMLILAERATNEEEKLAAFGKAQQLSDTYSIEMEVARQSVAKLEQRETPIQKRITIGEPRKPLNAVFCSLFMEIGRAQDLKFNIAHNSTYVIAFGFPSDIAVTEAFYAAVSVQMIHEGDAFVKGGTWKGETTLDTTTWAHKPVTSRVAKRCFYEEYIGRIGSRLRNAKREKMNAVRDEQVITSEGVTSTALVMANKSVEVSDFYHQTSRARGSWKGNRGNTANSTSGRTSGREAGSKARLGGEKSIGGGRKSIG